MHMSELDDLVLKHREIGAAPIVRHVFDRLGLDDLLVTHVPERAQGRPAKIPHARALSAMVTNALLSRRPLYAVPEWLSGHVLAPFKLTESEVHLFNDDRIGRALDRLFVADRASLMTAVIRRAVDEFEIDLDQIHNDTTTVTFSGSYDGQTDPEELKRPPLITFGHNKDHRPDLKQLVWSLTVSADGAVPVHYKTYDGNTTDDKVHRDAWCAIRDIAGRPDFVYVADSKLCTRENMSFIASNGGRFVTVLPRTRREHGEFDDQLRIEGVSWEEVRRDKNPRGATKPDLVYEAHDPKRCTAEGYRVLWYRSSSKAAQDEKSRRERIVRARQRLEELENRSGAHRLRSVERAEQAVAAILHEQRVTRWLKVEVDALTLAEFKQAHPGRPGRDTSYKKTDTSIIVFRVEEDQKAIETDAATDGVFAMVTNMQDESPREILDIYKYQPNLEKRFEQFKSVLTVAPVFLKKPERVASLLFVYFLAVLVFALIERELRKGMANAGIASLPLYPERRACRAPTTAVVLQAVEGIRKSELVDREGRVLRAFYDELRPELKDMLRLIGVDLGEYGLDQR
jgi:transposase